MGRSWYKKALATGAFVGLLGSPVPPGLAEEKAPVLAPAASIPNLEAPISDDDGRIVLSVHWEGRDLTDANLTALAEIRAEFPDFPMIHFISPAYFLRSPAEALAARQKIRTVMRSQDQVGLALGGWKSLVTKAGAIFRSGPTFWGYALRPQDCELDCGQDIPVHIYPETELDKIMVTALKTLEEHGFGRPKGLAVTGWVASPQVLEAAARAGIAYDFSSVATQPLEKTIGHYPLLYWVKGLWSKPGPSFWAYKIPTQSSVITEVPQTLPAMDHVKVVDVMRAFTDFTESKDDSSDLIPGERRGRVFQIVLHQETAAITASRTLKLLGTILSDNQKRQKSLLSLTVPGMGVPSDSGVDTLAH